MDDEMLMPLIVTSATRFRSRIRSPYSIAVHMATGSMSADAVAGPAGETRPVPGRYRGKQHRSESPWPSPMPISQHQSIRTTATSGPKSTPSRTPQSEPHARSELTPSKAAFHALNPIRESATGNGHTWKPNERTAYEMRLDIVQKSVLKNDDEAKADRRPQTITDEKERR
jgi:hypothetical protein